MAPVTVMLIAGAFLFIVFCVVIALLDAWSLFGAVGLVSVGICVIVAAVLSLFIHAGKELF